jgi:hypothetical protein
MSPFNGFATEFLQRLYSFVGEILNMPKCEWRNDVWISVMFAVV